MASGILGFGGMAPLAVVPVRRHRTESGISPSKAAPGHRKGLARFQVTAS